MRKWNFCAGPAVISEEVLSEVKDELLEWGDSGMSIMEMSHGGGDMPVVISLLNSFSGIAAAFAGLLLLNNVLIVAGSLVGASGLILTVIMAKAMNRSISNILFVGYASSSSKSSSSEDQGEVSPISVSDATTQSHSNFSTYAF